MLDSVEEKGFWHLGIEKDGGSGLLLGLCPVCMCDSF